MAINSNLNLNLKHSKRSSIALYLYVLQNAGCSEDNRMSMAMRNQQWKPSAIAPSLRKRRFFTAFLSVAALVMASIAPYCAGRHTMSTAEIQTVHLDIPDKGWDPDRPDPTVGWCAEACIQMAMAYYGKQVSQKQANAAGKPSHADLWMDDIDRALDNLGVAYQRWDDSETELSSYIFWIQRQLGMKYPVICGIKIYPDTHPNWFLDHFVVAVGFDREGLILNTNIEGQRRVSYRQLSSFNSGYSFKSTYNHYFGRAITGLR
jgi:hypothetical protein